VSARTGAGIEELRLLVARELPRPSTLVEVLLPYDRGDLVSRLHDVGELLAQEHRPEGTWLRALVPARLAGELSPYLAQGWPVAAAGTAPSG